MDFTHLSQQLADLHVSQITMAAFVLTALRVVTLRIGRVGMRELAEVIEAFLIAGVVVFMIVQPFIMKSFYIPSGSMLPTLMDDDHIVVNKLLYRLRKPHVGDVVVFIAPDAALRAAQEPKDSEDGPIHYIKRMIGDSGDVIETRHGYITVNGTVYTHTDIRNRFPLTDNDNQHVKIEANDLFINDGQKWTHYDAEAVATFMGSPGAPVKFFPGETIRNGHVLDEPYTAEDPSYDLKIVDGHSLISDPDVGTRIDNDVASPQELADYAKMPPGKVPEGDIFVMGDNRNDSNDSTRWGPLNRSAAVGKASFVFFPFPRIQVIH